MSAHAPATAQQWHSIDRADVRYYADLLELDDTQREAAIDLHREYVTEMRRIGEAMRDQQLQDATQTMQDVREGRLASAYFGSMLRAIAPDGDRLDRATRLVDTERELLDDVLALAATPEQHTRVERAWCRDRASALESPWGDSADVAAMVREAGLAAADRVEAILLEYEVEIHPLRRMFLSPAPGQAQPDAPPEGEPPAWQDQALRAKRINTRYAVRINNVLPAEHHDEWDRAVREAFWPEPYERSGPQKVLGVLLRAKDLTIVDRTELEDIQSRYERRAGTINRTWALAIDAHLHADVAQDWESAGEANEIIHQCREDRRQLDKEFEAILSELGRNR